MVLTVAGQAYPLSAGDSYVIDTGEPHSFSNPSGQVCRIVSAHTRPTSSAETSSRLEKEPVRKQGS